MWLDTYLSLGVRSRETIFVVLWRKGGLVRQAVMGVERVGGEFDTPRDFQIADTAGLKYTLNVNFLVNLDSLSLIELVILFNVTSWVVWHSFVRLLLLILYYFYLFIFNFFQCLYPCGTV